MLRRILKAIDTISEYSGKLVAWLLVVLVAELMWDVTARYVFGIATKWSFDISYMIGATVVIFGASYVLLHRSHVRIDILYSRYSPKAKLLYDIILMSVFFVPAVSFLLRGSIDTTIYAVKVHEFSHTSFWQPPIYPLRIILSIGIALLLLQGIATLVRDVSAFLGHELPSEIAGRL